MLWKHNIVAPSKEYSFVGRKITADPNGFCLWLVEQRAGKTWRLPFSRDGRLGKTQPVADYNFDAFLSYSGGYALTKYASPVGKVQCYAQNHSPVWSGELKDADSLYWDAMSGENGAVYLAYSSRNVFDAFEQAHVVKIDTANNTPASHLFTVPEEDYSCAQVLIPMPERFALCVRNKGAGVIFHILDFAGNPLANGSFAAHPHSRWGVPVCHVPLANGETLMGGWQEKIPGKRLPWLARFDADLDVLYGASLPVAYGENAVSQLCKASDGGIFALCAPWTVFRLSSRGFPTHVWEVPGNLRANAIQELSPLKDGACLITGSSYTHDGGSIHPAVWLGAVDGQEFAQL